MPIADPDPKVFPTALARIMETRGISLISLSRASGVSLTRCHSFCAGRYRSIQTDHLGRILAAVSPNAEDHRTLLLAYYQDLTPSQFVGLVDTTSQQASGARVEEQAAPLALPPSFRKSWERLRKLCETVPAVRRKTAGWIELVDAYATQKRASRRAVKPVSVAQSGS